MIPSLINLVRPLRLKVDDRVPQGFWVDWSGGFPVDLEHADIAGVEGSLLPPSLAYKFRTNGTSGAFRRVALSSRTPSVTYPH